MGETDLVIIGAGPAGMAAAIAARRHGLDVLLIDEQPAPGGQIWRAIEAPADPARDAMLGDAYLDGRDIARTFRATGARYAPGTQVWQIDPGFTVHILSEGVARSIPARAVLLATGAQERPVAFPGWTLPGVLTVGAAQILLKAAAQVPGDPVWVAGSGPLPLLYLTQLLHAGGRVAGYLDTTPAGRWKAALRHLPAALGASADLVKGLRWMTDLRRRGVPVIRHVAQIEALGDMRMSALRYRTQGGQPVTVPATTLLVHEGVVPALHMAMSMGCAVDWDERQDCHRPRLDRWGESSVDRLFIAGDGAGIGGAKAALLRGTIAALGVVRRLRPDTGDRIEAEAWPLAGRLRGELAIRPFLDAMFRPRPEAFDPPDRTIVCRCEEVTAGAVRAAASIGRAGPNQVKAATRIGMGPCQGRQCGQTLTRLIAATQQRTPADVGALYIRPPLKPITLGQLATLDQEQPSP